MLKDGVGMVSVLGKLETGSFFEHVIQPRLGAILLGGNPLGLVNDPESERVLASGQFLLFDRSAYHRIGGHEGIRDSVLDDVDLATKRQTKRRRISTLFREYCFQVSHVQRSWRNLVRLVEKIFFLRCTIVCCPRL